MLTEQEKQFLINWENVRLKQSTNTYKLLSGLPMAFMFSLPIMFFFIIVKMFLPSWFTTATYKSNDVILPQLTAKFINLSIGDVAMVLIAVIIIIIFFSYFRMHYKWEMNEQLYEGLKYKEKKILKAAL